MLLPILLGGLFLAQTPGADLVRAIDDQPPPEAIFFRCANGAEEAALQQERSRKLVELGAAALPEIRRAIASIEEAGAESKHLGSLYWLALVYAKIDGQAAYPALRRMVEDERFESIRPWLSSAMTVELGVTGYVDHDLVPGQVICRAAEPRDALAQFIYAWETGDRDMLDEALGPNAEAALSREGRQIEKHEWVAVGFRFEDASGSWSRPLDPFAVPSGPDSMSDPAPVIETRFTDQNGNVCGSARLAFTMANSQRSWRVYVLNSSNLADVVRIVERCARP